MNKSGYLLGAVIILALIVGGYYLLTKPADTRPTENNTVIPVQTSAPLPSDTPALSVTPTVSASPTAININITLVSPTPGASVTSQPVSPAPSRSL